ncbi:aminoglycoside phosphotransferase family protein [Oricola sp.]|uniref:aminoglycoside phosphotransferase family protein n=1 Tax=Oricola sp. TaxID=1979950 RepID=UPI002600547E|nr:aminoglycoside phosphotransferase family protein [Oricola sp.]MCI5077681.1 aminoglycoside phosphotransferase family protein [Oricola sp.]
MAPNDLAAVFDETPRMEFGASLVRTLIAGQFPQWADLPVVPVEPQGWCNRTFRLGETMSVRLPSAHRYVRQVEKEHRFLPALAPKLPLPVPAPLAIGKPAGDYPWPWSVYGWLDGESALIAKVDDKNRFAEDLAGFLYALQAIDATDGPPAGVHNFFRGGSLAVYDAQTRDAVAALHGEIDAEAALAVWEAALASTWTQTPVWVHGDVAAGNLLVRDGLLRAVIDFGSLGVGDPACDLAICWAFLDGRSRATFRAALPLDEATWARGRGWALWKALITIAGAADRQSPAAAEARSVLDTVIASHFGNS